MKDRMKVCVEIDPSCDTPEVIIKTSKQTELVEELLSAINNCVENETQRITVYDGSITRIISQNEIIRVYTEMRKLKVCTDKGVFENRCTLQDMEKLLESDRFLRISRFEIINMEKVAGFDISVSGTIKVLFEDGTFTWVTRRFVRDIEKRLEQLYMKGGRSDE